MKDLQNEILEMKIPNNFYKKKKWKICKETRQEEKCKDGLITKEGYKAVTERNCKGVMSKRLKLRMS